MGLPKALCLWGGRGKLIMAVACLLPEGRQNARPITSCLAAVLAVAAVCAVVALSGDDETVHQGMMAPVSPMQNALAQHLAKYDDAIHKVDEGIANSKTQLVMQSRRLGQATKFALALHNKLQQDHQILLSETARSRAMKAVRSQLALKEKRVMMERRQLQVDSMQLAGLEQKARTLLSPQFRPSAAELQVSARNIHVKIPESPPMFMLQGKGDLASNVAKKVSGAGVDPTLAHTIQNSINEGLKQH